MGILPALLHAKAFSNNIAIVFNFLNNKREQQHGINHCSGNHKRQQN